MKPGSVAVLGIVIISIGALIILIGAGGNWLASQGPATLSYTSGYPNVDRLDRYAADAFFWLVSGAIVAAFGVLLLALYATRGTRMPR